MTKFRERDRVRVEFEGEVIVTEAPHPDASKTNGYPGLPRGMWLQIDDKHAAFIFPQHATLLNRPENEEERVARLERENAEMKARLAALEADEKKERYTIVVDPMRDLNARMEHLKQFSDEALADTAPVADKKPPILIDKLTRWFAKR